jgi:hypothetical protein
MMMARKGDRMHPRWSLGTAVARHRALGLRRAPERHRAPLRLASLGAAIALTAAGCSHSAATVSQPAKRCGTARTVANVPVKVEIMHGTTPCPAAMTVEHDYTKAIAQGRAPGNGGGGPVTISGWKCQGFPTPIVLRTGWASKCVRGGTEILAILPPPKKS